MNVRRKTYSLLIAFTFFICCLQHASAQTYTLPPETMARVDQAANEVLASTGVPSASVAVVSHDQIVYQKAYGYAKLESRVPAKPGMRYSIGSISKQFTAAAILLLAEDGKLSLDDPVSKFIPTLTRANEVTIRMLLSHTSGYQDYWPQDYIPPFMLQPVSSDKILDLWARKPLDFDPGTQWQYSNTNFVIAGLIIEQASGMPLMQFLKTRIFVPAGMTSVMNIDESNLEQTDASGYLRYALGPLRLAPKEGKGWLFAMGELAMPAQDLAKWDVSMLKHSILKPESYRAMERDTLRKDGMATRYGLGIFVMPISGHRSFEHSGETSGFTAENIVLPDDHAAVVVLVNQDSVDAGGQIARKIAPLLFTEAKTDSAKIERDKGILLGLQQGVIDRTLFTTNANAYFSELAIGDFKSSLGALGKLTDFTLEGQNDRGGMRFREYSAKFEKKSVDLWTREMPDGKLEQYEVLPDE